MISTESLTNKAYTIHYLYYDIIYLSMNIRQVHCIWHCLWLQAYSIFML
jgi:hypothetical protein